MTRTEAKAKIKEVRLLNPEWGSRRIARHLQINENIVKSVLYPYNHRKRFRFARHLKQTVFAVKRKRFRHGYSLEDQHKYYFSLKQFEEKVRSHPYDEYTGWKLDIEDPKDWSPDHRIPRSLGGNCSLENCAITSTKVNMAKGNQSIEEFLEMCRAFCRHTGGDTVIPGQRQNFQETNQLKNYPNQALHQSQLL